MTGKREVRKVNTDEIEGEYILKNTDPGKKKIIFSTVIWYDPETEKYYFKSESDMNGNRLAGQVVSHKLMQDLLSISKWMLKPLGELWDDPSRVHSGGIDTEKMAVDWKLGWKPKKQIRRALKRQDDQKKAENNAKDVLYRDKVARELGCCAKCHRRITPESQSTFDEHYVCKWCNQKNLTNCKENEYSDFAKEDSK